MSFFPLLRFKKYFQSRALNKNFHKTSYVDQGLVEYYQNKQQLKMKHSILGASHLPLAGENTSRAVLVK